MIRHDDLYPPGPERFRRVAPGQYVPLPPHGRADVDLGAPTPMPELPGGEVLIDYTDPDGERLRVLRYPDGAIVLAVAEAGTGFTIAVDLSDPATAAAVGAAVLGHRMPPACGVCGNRTMHASDCPEAVRHGQG